MSHLIERLGHLGDGIAPGPVYAARTLPGEVVDGEIVGGRIEKPKILTPSPDRVKAPCAHYNACGGCAVMHASDSFVAGWKADVVVRALAAQGLSAAVGEVVTSPERSRRRATLTGRRLKSGPVVGFRMRGGETVTAIPECRLLRPEIMAAIPALEAVTALMGSRRGALRLAVTLSEAGVDLEVGEAGEPDGPQRIALAGLAAEHDLARLSVGGDVIVERRPPRQGFGVVPPPGAFLQATEEGEAALLSRVRRAVGDVRRVADLFSGCGTFALPLAEGAEVHAVEGDGAMTGALDRAWRTGKGLKRVTTEVRDLFRRPLEPDELDRFDAVVIDPPAAGAEAQSRAIAASGVRRVAAVSCNPVTFARDAAILAEAGFGIAWIDVIDQFRWSPHVELAALLHRA